MKLNECLHTESRCWKYKGGDGYYPAKPVGILLHTTGVNNPNLKRYTQPSSNESRRAELLNTAGMNAASRTYYYFSSLAMVSNNFRKPIRRLSGSCAIAYSSSCPSLIGTIYCRFRKAAASNG